jgi:hypothetical protein
MRNMRAPVAVTRFSWLAPVCYLNCHKIILRPQKYNYYLYAVFLD